MYTWEGGKRRKGSIPRRIEGGRSKRMWEGSKKESKHERIHERERGREGTRLKTRSEVK